LKEEFLYNENVIFIWIIEVVKGMGFIRWLFGKDESISNDAIEHSSKGEFTYHPKTKKISKMKSGGHGQENIEFLNQNNLRYQIVKEYNNGVRVGNVPDHKTPKKRTGTNQSWFPKDWDRKEIRKAGNFVARSNRKKEDGVQAVATYKGVKIGIRRTNGKVATIYPISKQKGGFKNEDRKHCRKSK